MVNHAVCVLAAASLSMTAGMAALAGQTVSGSVESHVAAARAAGGELHSGLFSRLCSPEALTPPPPRPTAATPARRPPPPPRWDWHVEPVKVFDNLYYVGEREYSAWAVTTSAGIIIIDTIFDYSVRDQVVEGLTKLGLDPKQIKYAIVSHAHYDHSGGAEYLQEVYGAKVIMSAADWDMMEKNTRDPSKPKRDMVATDGMTLSLGDTTLTLYVTPGHTPGTLSTLVPVKDGGRSHLAAAWGGTAFNFARSPEAFKTYVNSAQRFRDIVTKAGADVLIANHTIFDGTKTKVPALATRKTGEPHPYVIGTSAVQAYLTVANECAQAALLSLPGAR